MSIIGDTINKYGGNELDYYPSAVGEAIDDYFKTGKTSSNSLVGDAINSYSNNNRNTSFGIGGKLSNFGDLFKNSKGTLLGALGGGLLGAIDSGNKKNLIKSSYYKNPYLTAALTPEYSLNDNINNFVGTLGMNGGNKNGGFISNLFSSSLTGNANNGSTGDYDILTKNLPTLYQYNTSLPGSWLTDDINKLTENYPEIFNY